MKMHHIVVAGSFGFAANKADVDATMHLKGNDLTALNIAKIVGHMQIVELLRKHEAKE